MPCGEEEGVLAHPITKVFIRGEERVSLRHGIEQALLIDKWKQCNTLPLHLLSIEVDLEGFGIEVDDLAVFIRHQSMEWLRESMS